jgi:uncharacterized protein YlzI (FlbEa/FlbD family)
MALNLVTLTSQEGPLVEVNPAAIATVETISGRTVITLTSGRTLEVRDSQARVRELMNRRPPDGQ